MAFNKKDSGIGATLDELDSKKELTPVETKDNSKRISFELKKVESEQRKKFTFSLEPSTKLRLDNLARENGYRSTSAFLNDLIKKINVQ